LPWFLFFLLLFLQYLLYFLALKVTSSLSLRFSPRFLFLRTFPCSFYYCYRPDIDRCQVQCTDAFISFLDLSGYMLATDISRILSFEFPHGICFDVSQLTSLAL
jgi:hypothetical protein